MASYTIREGSTEEIEHFDLYDEANEGNTILVTVSEQGEVVAFAQTGGETIFFLQSNARGAGTAIVDYLKSQCDHLVADHTDKNSAGYWQHVGFERIGRTDNFEWYAE